MGYGNASFDRLIMWSNLNMQTMKWAIFAFDAFRQIVLSHDYLASNSTLCILYRMGDTITIHAHVLPFFLTLYADKMGIVYRFAQISKPTFSFFGDKFKFCF